MMSQRRFALVIVTVFCGMLSVAGQSPSAPASGASTVDATYPGLANAGLTYATLGDLPDGLLLRAGSLDLASKDLDEELARVPESAREGLNKNRFFLLEQMATKRIILDVAKQEAASKGADIASKSEQDILDAYAETLVGQVTVTDEEVAAFYAENRDACGGAALDDIKNQLREYVATEKKQGLIKDHIRTLGQRTPIVVSSAWAAEQSAAAKDNPVDKARGSGTPTIVDFGADGCRPCDMMTPILATLKTKYEGKVNVLFVHVREEQVLASRYGIQSIPVQIFFDKDGKETYRHTGFFAQAEIEKKLLEMGVQ